MFGTFLSFQEADKPGASLQQQLEAQKAQDLLLDAHRPYIAREVGSLLKLLEALCPPDLQLPVKWFQLPSALTHPD